MPASNGLDEAHQDADDDCDQSGDDRHEPAATEEGQVGRQLDPVVPPPQQRSRDTHDEAAEDAEVDQLLGSTSSGSPGYGDMASVTP